jgi:hypothetical protein
MAADPAETTETNRRLVKSFAFIIILSLILQKHFGTLIVHEGNWQFKIKILH